MSVAWKKGAAIGALVSGVVVVAVIGGGSDEAPSPPQDVEETVQVDSNDDVSAVSAKAADLEGAPETSNRAVKAASESITHAQALGFINAEKDDRLAEYAKCPAGMVCAKMHVLGIAIIADRRDENRTQVHTMTLAGSDSPILRGLEGQSLQSEPVYRRIEAGLRAYARENGIKVIHLGCRMLGFAPRLVDPTGAKPVTVPTDLPVVGERSRSMDAREANRAVNALYRRYLDRGYNKRSRSDEEEDAKRPPVDLFAPTRIDAMTGERFDRPTLSLWSVEAGGLVARRPASDPGDLGGWYQVRAWAAVLFSPGAKRVRYVDAYEVALKARNGDIERAAPEDVFHQSAFAMLRGQGSKTVHIRPADLCALSELTGVETGLTVDVSP